MPKKNESRNQLPDFETVSDPDEISKLISEAETSLARKYKLLRQSQQAQQDLNAGYRDQQKILKEDLEHYVEAISGWQERQRVLNAQSNPAPAPKATKVVQPLRSVPAPAPVAEAVEAVATAVPETTAAPLPPETPPLPPPAVATTGVSPFPPVRQVY